MERRRLYIGGRCCICVTYLLPRSPVFIMRQIFPALPDWQERGAKPEAAKTSINNGKSHTLETERSCHALRLEPT